MDVVPAHPDDLPGWLALAAEVEPLFGPMVDDPAFRATLRRKIDEGTAWCVRALDGPPGAPLAGALLLSIHPPVYKIGWLAVAARCRRAGVARVLVEHTFGLVRPPAEMSLTTFADGVSGGEAARAFYEQMGFRPAEPGSLNPAGVPTQIFRRTFPGRITVRAVIERDGRYLLVQHHYINPAHLGKWSIPGGRIDPGDPDHAATLRRELREEFRVESELLDYLGAFPHEGNVHHCYRVRVHDFDFAPAPDEIAGLDWFTFEEVAALHAGGTLLGGFVLDAIAAHHAL